MEVAGSNPVLTANLLNGVGNREVFTLNSQLIRKNIVWTWSVNHLCVDVTIRILELDGEIMQLVS